jgi:hypothetical protein
LLKNLGIAVRIATLVELFFVWFLGIAIRFTNSVGDALKNGDAFSSEALFHVSMFHVFV